MNETVELLLGYVRSAWRFRWWALAVAWVVSLAGWGVIALQPDVYEASARIYVDPSSELRRLLQNQIVESNVENELSFVRETLLGRTQLRRVAEKTGLDRDRRTEREKDALADVLGRQIQLSGGMPNHRGQREQVYHISYQNHDRQMAIDVVSTVLNTFVEDSVGVKRSSSEAAGRFLREQIAEYEERLQFAEQRVAEFNRLHFDRLPSLQGGYFQRLQTATEELNNTRQALRLAESRLERIEQQLRGEAPRISTTGQVDPDSLEGRILSNQARLDELLLRFTENHPDVIATREVIQQLETRRAEANRELRSGSGASSNANNPVFQALMISRNEAEAEIATLRADVADRSARMAELRGLINEMPEVEAELARLNRDYDVINAHYQSLLNSLERDQLSREVFQSEQIDFRIIEPPSASLQPVAPKRSLLILLALMAGCGAAGGLAIVLGQLKPVFQAPTDLQLATDLPVLGTIGRYWSDGLRRRQVLDYAGFGVGALLLAVTFAGVFAFEIFGPGLRGMR